MGLLKYMKIGLSALHLVMGEYFKHKLYLLYRLTMDYIIYTNINLDHIILFAIIELR